MPSVQYYNQSAPFWDWVANFEEQAKAFAATQNQQEGSSNETNEENPQPNPWAQGWAGFPFGGPFAQRGRHGPPHHQEHEAEPAESNEKEGEAGPSEARGPPPHAHEGRGGKWGGPRGGRCGGMRGRGGWGGRGGHGHGHGHGHGPRGSGFPGPMGPFGPLAEMFQQQFFGDSAPGTKEKSDSDDFTPFVDVFDTADSFIVHVSLPGAKKEDVGVSYDAEKSELSIAGVVYRPGDEELLKTLALDERKNEVGAFERKVRLGSRANPASIDADGISAKLEDGVLRIDVPKMEAGFVEVRKVDIE